MSCDERNMKISLHSLKLLLGPALACEVGFPRWVEVAIILGHLNKCSSKRKPPASDSGYMSSHALSSGCVWSNDAAREFELQQANRSSYRCIQYTENAEVSSFNHT